MLGISRLYVSRIEKKLSIDLARNLKSKAAVKGSFCFVVDI